MENEIIEADKIINKKTSKEIIVQDSQDTGIDSILQLAIKNNGSVEAISKIMEMKYRYEDRESKKLFHSKFSDMQVNFPAIKKTNAVGNAYKYASLDDILLQIKPILHQYGFTYRWSESLTDSKDFKRITCHITGHGHEETSFSDVPVMSASKMTNAVQQVGSSSTYGKRYSLSGVLGLTFEDDDDGQGANNQTKQPEKKADIGQIRNQVKALFNKIDNPPEKMNEAMNKIETYSINQLSGMGKKLSDYLKYQNEK